MSEFEPSIPQLLSDKYTNHCDLKQLGLIFGKMRHFIRLEFSLQMFWITYESLVHRAQAVVLFG